MASFLDGGEDDVVDEDALWLYYRNVPEAIFWHCRNGCYESLEFHGSTKEEIKEFDDSFKISYNKLGKEQFYIESELYKMYKELYPPKNWGK